MFSYISLNANGYAFDQDFDILSFGDGTDNDIGFWGAGTSSKDIVDLGGGNFEYRLVGTGEPHGTIRFKGTFNAVSWRSLSNEFWNGFTVGIQGTAIQVCDIDPTTPGCRQNVPEPAMWALLSLGAFGIGYQRKQRERS